MSDGWVLEGEAAEQRLELALPILNQLRRVSERRELRLTSGTTMAAALLAHTRNDDGWDWCAFEIAVEPGYRIRAEVCGSPGALESTTHFPALTIIGDREAALADLHGLAAADVSAVSR